MTRRNEWIVAFAAGMGALLFGYEVGVIGQVLGMDSFKRNFKMSIPDNYIQDKDQTSEIRYLQTSLSLTHLFDVSNWTESNTSASQPSSVKWHDSSDMDESLALITSTFLIGCILGTLIGAFLSDIIGRKYSILIGGVIFTMGGLLQCLSKTLEVLLLGRVVSGVAIGITSLVVPIYIAEVSSAAERGALTVVYQLMITVGIVLATSVNAVLITAIPGDSPLLWRLALAMQMVPSVLLIFIVARIPKSPRWLVQNGREHEARIVMALLRGREVFDEDITKELNAIIAGVQVEQQQQLSQGSRHCISVLAEKGIRRRLFVAVVNQSFNQLSGINVILYYSVTIFSAMGFNAEDTMVIFPVVNAVIYCLATFPGLYLVDKVGRRPLLIWGGMFIGFAHLLVYVFLSLAFSTPAGSKNTIGLTADERLMFSWCALVAIYLFLISFASTWGPIVWSYQAEIFPIRVRARATSIATVANWTWNAVIAYAFPLVFYTSGQKPAVYLIFSGFGFLMSIWAYFYIIETCGRSLEDIDDLFRENAKAYPSSSYSISSIQYFYNLFLGSKGKKPITRKFVSASEILNSTRSDWDGCADIRDHYEGDPLLNKSRISRRI